MSDTSQLEVKLGRTKPRPKYVSLAATSLQQAIAYRTSTVMNLLIGFVWVLISYYLWGAVFSQRGAIGGFSWDEMRTYIVLGFGLNALVGWRVSAAMGRTITTGDVVLD